MEVNAGIIDYEGKPADMVFLRDISERKRMENDLRDSERRYRTIFETAGAAICILENDAIISMANNKFEKLTGYSKKEIEGKKKWAEFVENEHLGRIKGYHQKRRDGYGSVPENYDFRLINKAGEVRHVNLSVSMFPGTMKSVTSLVDITERVSMEKALKESEERYRTIIENIEDGYFELDLHGSFTFFNDSLCRIIGYPRDEMMGMNYRFYSDPSVIDSMFRIANNTFKTGEPIRNYDWEIIRKNGTRRHVEISMNLMKGPEDLSVGFRGIMRDITERKRTEEKLRMVHQEKLELIEQTTESIISIDMNGKIEMANPAAEALFDRSQEELQDTSIESILDLSAIKSTFPDLSRENECTKQTFHADHIRDLETEVSRPDGSKIPVMLNAAVRRHDQARINGLIMAISDIRERKKMRR